MSVKCERSVAVSYVKKTVVLTCLTRSRNTQFYFQYRSVETGVQDDKYANLTGAYLEGWSVRMSQHHTPPPLNSASVVPTMIARPYGHAQTRAVQNMCVACVVFKQTPVMSRFL